MKILLLVDLTFYWGKGAQLMKKVNFILDGVEELNCVSAQKICLSPKVWYQ